MLWVLDLECQRVLSFNIKNFLYFCPLCLLLKKTFLKRDSRSINSHTHSIICNITHSIIHNIAHTHHHQHNHAFISLSACCERKQCMIFMISLAVNLLEHWINWPIWKAQLFDTWRRNRCICHLESKLPTSNI